MLLSSLSVRFRPRDLDVPRDNCSRVLELVLNADWWGVGGYLYVPSGIEVIDAIEEEGEEDIRKNESSESSSDSTRAREG